jgi:SPP1 family phage portal protein
MYITEQDLANLKIQTEGNRQITLILQDLIKDDEKAKADMQAGIEYFDGDHKIKDRKITYIIDGVSTEDLTKANNKIANPFLAYIVEQKANYIAGNPISITPDDEEFAQVFNDARSDKFDELMIDYIRQASFKGYEVLHPFINERGEFDNVIIPAEQCILIYDGKFKRDLIALIRYYLMTFVYADGTEDTRYKVEWWTAEDVTFYVQTKNGDYELDADEPVNPRPHFQISVKSVGKTIDSNGGGWGRIPFIVLKNNTKFQSDLKKIKALIDDYDLNMSDFSNSLTDLQEAFYVLKGYDGEKLSEFVHNLKTYHACKVDGEDAGITVERAEIPHDPRDSHLDRLHENIFFFGQGVDPTNDAFGNSPSGIALKWLFMPMEIKCNGIMRSASIAIKELLWFYAEYMKQTQRKNFDATPNKIKVVFNVNLLVNETELIENCQNSKGVSDLETIVARHPWNTNPKETLLKLKTEVLELAAADSNQDDQNQDDNGGI